MDTKKSRCLTFLQTYFPGRTWIKYVDEELKLDLYCSELKLGVLYKHHIEDAREKKREVVCRQRGITLIKVLEPLEDFLEKKLREIRPPISRRCINCEEGKWITEFQEDSWICKSCVSQRLYDALRSTGIPIQHLFPLFPDAAKKLLEEETVPRNWISTQGDNIALKEKTIREWLANKGDTSTFEIVYDRIRMRSVVKFSRRYTEVELGNLASLLNK